MLGQKRVQLRNLVAGNLICLAGIKTEYKGQRTHHRKQHKGHQRHAHADRQHHYRIAYDFYYIFKEAHQNAGKKLIDRLRVIADAGYQLAHGRGIKKA